MNKYLYIGQELIDLRDGRLVSGDFGFCENHSAHAFGLPGNLKNLVADLAATVVVAFDSLDCDRKKSITLPLKPELELPSRKCKMLRHALRDRANFAAATCAKNYGDRLVRRNICIDLFKNK